MFRFVLTIGVVVLALAGAQAAVSVTTNKPPLTTRGVAATTNAAPTTKVAATTTRSAATTTKVVAVTTRMAPTTVKPALTTRSVPTTVRASVAAASPRVSNFSVLDTAYSFNASRRLNTFILNGSILLTSSSYVYATFVVSCNSASDCANTTFSVPDFDEATGNFSDITERMPDEAVTANSTTIKKIKYFISRDDLAANKLCSIQGTAAANMRGGSSDKVSFAVDFEYPLTVASISLDRSDNSTGQCSCLFKCETNACPPPSGSLRYEWALYDGATTIFSNAVFRAGNVPSQPDRYQLNPTECQAKFNLARQSHTGYQIACRVVSNVAGYSPFSSLSTSYVTPLWSLVRPCTSNEFQCANSKECVLSTLRCNGRQDCTDGSDETGCMVGSCRIGQFHCPTSQECIEHRKVCDGFADCADNADERDCTKPSTPCAVGYFKCDNGRCTRSTFVCDGDDDCHDGSDERRCGGGFSLASSCASGQFVCTDGNCVSNSYLCDGINNCRDNSDELKCGNYSSIFCSSGYWQCANARCIASYSLCDGANDCGDNSDELVCRAGNGNSLATTSRPGVAVCNSATQFQCSNGRCIYLGDKCDGTDDCGDGSDEASALCSCSSGQFRCTNGRCIPASYVCDGDNDCRDYSDEGDLCTRCDASQNLWRCPISQKCISTTRLCNNVVSCSTLFTTDNSDEGADACALAQSLNAVNTSCPSGTIKCGSSFSCVPVASLCDGVSDCCPRSNASSSLYFSVSISENATHYGNCEKTDEIGCDKSATCQVSNGGCQSTCISVVVPPEPNVCGGQTLPGQAAYCTCDAGYTRPLNNLKLCVDIDECQASPVANNCSQTCTNTNGSYQCGCQSGFIDAGIAAGRSASGLCVVDQSSGVTNETSVFLINGDTIRMFNKTARTLSIIDWTTLDNPYSAMAIDIRDRTVIFAQSGVPVLRRTSIPINGQQPPSLALAFQMAYNQVVDMSVDFIGGNLYVADVDASGIQPSRIVVSLVDGRYQKTIFRSYTSQATSIAVNPLLGRLYYATYPKVAASSYYSSSYQAALMMASMNGSVSTKIYSPSTSYQIIKSIAVDFLASGHIYFYDGASIVLANADGKGNASFTLSVFTAVNRPFDVFGNVVVGLFSSYSYLSSTDAHKLYEVDKFSRLLAVNVTGPMYEASFVRVHHDLKAGNRVNWPNPCAALKCSQLCLLNMEKGASCAGSDRDYQDRATSPSAQVEAPQHPADCYRNCVKGQGVCTKDPNREAIICLCNPTFSGPTCNETATPTIVTKPSTIAATVAPTVATAVAVTPCPTAAISAVQNLARNSGVPATSGHIISSLLIASTIVASIKNIY